MQYSTLQSRLIRYFLILAGIVLLITSVAKIISGFGGSRILQNLDPVIGLTFRHVFWLVGAIELAIAFLCLFGKRIKFQAGVLAWLATAFVLYRFTLFKIGYRKPCPCLGTLTDALHISPDVADTFMKIVIVFLLLGSYAILFWIWRGQIRLQTQTEG